jgi:DNA-binding Lrp family transcriptional regulator
VESEELGLKDVELKLIAELMKNSRRSDRALAKALGVSQPTVSRMIAKLQKEKVIREYTIVPDFNKLGFSIMSVFFMKTGADQPEKVKQTRETIREMEKEKPFPDILTMAGIGPDSDRVIVAFHESYSAYSEYIKMIRSLVGIDAETVQSFLVDLTDKSHYRYPSFSGLANYVLKTNETRERKQ